MAVPSSKTIHYPVYSRVRYLCKTIILIPCIFFCFTSTGRAQDYQTKNVLILVEGNTDLKNRAMGDGRQLAALMGHFNTVTTVKGVNQYTPNELEIYDITFYIGFTATNSVPAKFLNDVFSTSKDIFWINTGFIDFCRRYPVRKKFGFSVANLDSVSVFDEVQVGSKMFGKGEPITAVIEISERNAVSILATAVSSRRHRDTPYLVKSRNLTFIADSPFASASESDRYIYFADLLHDVLQQPHEQSHSALLRIEDVTPLDNPDRLRDIADFLSGRDIPFLVGVIPFYVDPSAGIRVSLSDKPDMVDALKYMVKNGGTIVMHGVTHQYKGTTAVDFEFWDEMTNKPIKDETPEYIAHKLETGIQEFMRNGLNPLIWETPHYTASFTLYSTVAKYFSTACEQRLSIEDFDYSQQFPYVIQKDLFGQRIYPENLGYVPLDSNKDVSRGYVETIIKNAKINLAVRDGFATAFFHSFLDIDLLEELVNGIQKAGYTYIDLSEHVNWVKTKDRIILSGNQDYTLELNDQYLLETYYDHNGEIKDQKISEKRILGKVTKSIILEPGEFYKAEPTEFRERPATIVDNVVHQAEKLYESIFTSEESWSDARVAILWNHFAKGAAFNDQASFAEVFRAVNINVDTIFVGQPIHLSACNLLIVPYAFVDSLKHTDYDILTQFVNQGGDIITDTRNDLAEELGIQFTPTRLRVSHIRDRFFPEERIAWQYPELVTKFETSDIDEVFCSDEVTEAPLVIGKKVGKGRFIFFATRFDSYSQYGTSQYPYLLEYVRKYFHVRPIVRRDLLEVYFDPGFRHTYSIEQLVRQWVNSGIRTVQVAGWHEYPKYTYDYERLIRLAHANGILVYLWIEPPQVSQKFWAEHPEWREKNYKMEDVRPSWRYPVSLTDDKCLAAMVNEYKNLLDQFDWDGVNLAELYFEAAKGFDDAKYFTPMHPSAQKEIKNRYGIDLTAIFNPQSPYYWKSNPAVKKTIVEYRIQRLKEVYETFLSVIADYAKDREGFSTLVTAMDSHGSPELREYLGVDIGIILELQKKYHFSLQVEDPEYLWSTSPLRYIEIGKRYKSLVEDSTKLYLDLNIGPFRKKEAVIPFPTLIQTGTESFLLVKAASLGAQRSTIYSEASINPQDLGFMANALAGEVQYKLNNNRYDVESPYSFTLKLPTSIQEVSVDGIPVSPFRDNVYIIPAGRHKIDLSPEAVTSFSTHELQSRIMSISANLLIVSYGLRDVKFTYESDMRTLASFNRTPTSVSVDGRKYNFIAMKGNDCYTIFLPPGKHYVELVAGDQFSYGVNLTSLWSSTFIAIFGFIAVSLLIVMYIFLKVIKRQSEITRA